MFCAFWNAYILLSKSNKKNNTIHGPPNQSLISTFVKAGDRDRVMCTKYKWSVNGYHRLLSLKEDVVLHTTRQSFKTPSPKKEDTFHWSTCIYAYICSHVWNIYVMCQFWHQPSCILYFVLYHVGLFSLIGIWNKLSIYHEKWFVESFQR